MEVQEHIRAYHALLSRTIEALWPREAEAVRVDGAPSFAQPGQAFAVTPEVVDVIASYLEERLGVPNGHDAEASRWDAIMGNRSSL